MAVTDGSCQPALPPDTSGMMSIKDHTGLMRGKLLSSAIRIGRHATMMFTCLCLTGCGLIVGGFVVGATALGLGGYGAYKAGEGVVDAAGDAAETGKRGVGSVTSGVRGWFSDGDFVATEEATVAEAFTATREAFAQMHFSTPLGNYDSLGGRVSAWTSDSESVIVRLEALTPSTTRLEIRVGTYGNDQKSRLIYNYIQLHLVPGSATKSGLESPDKT